jgi:hypothetical protein
MRSGRLVLLAELPRERAEPDHAQEHEPRDQHARDHVPAFLRGVCEQREHVASLTDAVPVEQERALDRFGARGLARDGLQRGRVVRLEERPVACLLYTKPSPRYRG